MIRNFYNRKKMYNEAFKYYELRNKYQIYWDIKIYVTRT